MGTNMKVTEGIEIVRSFGTCNWQLDADGGIQVLNKRKKLVYIGDRANRLEDLDDATTKAELNLAIKESKNWREDPEVLKLLGLREGYLEWGAFGFIEPNDSLLEVETLYSYSSDLVRQGYLTTKGDLMKKVLEAQGTFEL